MKIEIVAANLPRTEREAIERRVLLALSRFGPELSLVSVSLEEMANPLGGSDRRCRLRARLRGGALLRSEVIDDSFAAAVSRAATHLSQRISDGG